MRKNFGQRKQNIIKMLQGENCILLSWPVWENSVELFIQFTLARAFRAHIKNDIHFLSWTHSEWPKMMNSNMGIKFVSTYHSQRKPFYISHGICPRWTKKTLFFFMLWDAGASAKSSKSWDIFEGDPILKKYNSFFSGKAILNNMALKFYPEK